MSRRSIGWCIALGLALALAPGCASRTEVIVAVESDVPTLGVTYSSGPLGPYVATASGYTGTTLVVSREAIFAFIPGQTRVIHLDLLGRCEGVTCGTNMTCGESGCRDAMLQPSELEPYTGTISSHDAGPGSDGGAAVDTGVPCGGPCMLAHSSGATCQGGRCVIGTCDTGFDDCDGRDSTGCEADLSTDTQNCGRCGQRCFGGARMCCGGACHATCP